MVHDLLVSAKAELSKRGLDTERLRSLVEKHLQRSLEGLAEEDTGIEIDLTEKASQIANALEEELTETYRQEDASDDDSGSTQDA